MSFVKLTGEDGEDLWVRAAWVQVMQTLHMVDEADWTILQLVGGGELIVRGRPEDVSAALFSTTPAKRGMRSVGVQ